MRVSFDLGKRRIALSMASNEKEKGTETQAFVPLKGAYVNTSFAIPETLQNKAVFCRRI